MRRQTALRTADTIPTTDSAAETSSAPAGSRCSPTSRTIKPARFWSRLKVFRTDEENIDRFLKLVDEYQHCENYSDEMLAKMIEKVVIHERIKSKSGEPIRAMEVYLSFIGRLPMQ